MKSRIVLVLVFKLILIGSTFSQQPIWKEVILDDEINLNSLQTDTIGFIWGLCSNGLYQYDGAKMGHKISKSDDFPTFTSFSKDKDENFLIGIDSGKLVQYNPYSDKILATIQYRFSDPITFSDCVHTDYQCLLVSYGSGVIWKSGSIDTLLSTDNILISDEVYGGVLEDNRIILATDQGIQVITKNGQQLSSKVINKNDGLGDVLISHITQHNDNLIACNYDSQVYIIDQSTLKVEIIEMPVNSKINGLRVLKNEGLHVLTNMGVYALKDGIWNKKYPNKGFSQAIDATIDEENNLWACNKRNKLFVANLGFEVLPNNIARSQALLKMDDEFWIGSSVGLFLLKGAETTKILDNNVTSLRVLDDVILVGTYSSGIIILDHHGNITGSIDGWEKTPNQSVLYMYPKDDYLYISSLTGVVKVRMIKRGGAYSYTDYQNLNDVIGPGYVYQIIEENDVIYFATDRQGLKILRPDSVQLINTFSNGDPMESIYSMTKCDAGRMWFSTSSGYVGWEKDGEVYRLEHERFQQDPYTSLITSPDQKIVMVRNSSIDVHDPGSGHFLYFNTIKQLEDQELYLNCYTLEDRTIYLAKPNGVLIIDGFENQKLHPECTINKVIVNLIETEHTNVFSEDQNNLEFKYSSAWTTDPERITYQYRLKGFEDNWRTSRDLRAVYPMLRPGKYTFQVKASIDGNFSHDLVNEFKFQINQFFYKSWWFITLAILIIGGLIRRWRNERIKAKLQKEDLNKKRIEAQLISLQTQLHPHFL
ncbi:MAG: triple tyrosine motif-containing protein, partial [Bacteroidota bacterium]